MEELWDWLGPIGVAVGCFTAAFENRPRELDLGRYAKHAAWWLLVGFVLFMQLSKAAGHGPHCFPS